MSKYWIKIDSELGILGPQTARGSDDGWLPYIKYTDPVPQGKMITRNYEDHQVTEVLMDAPSFTTEADAIRARNRATRNRLLRQTTEQGWGDVDYRATQSADTVTAWDNYRQALRDMPTTHSEFSTRMLKKSDFPTKP